MRLVERLRGEVAGPPVFAPRVAHLAARLEQMSPDSLAANPGALARALHAAQVLLGLDTVVLDGSDGLIAACRSVTANNRDWWSYLEPEELAQTPRWLLVLETVARLRADADATGLVTLFPGPWALSEALGSGTPPVVEALEAAGDVCASAARAIAEARVGAVMVVEGDVPRQSADSAGAGLRSVCTVLRYYGVASAICLSRAVHATGPIGGAGADIVVTPAMDPFPSDATINGRGLALPTAWFSAIPRPNYPLVRDALMAAPGVRLVTTGGEVPDTTPPEVFRQMRGVIQGRFSQESH